MRKGCYTAHEYGMGLPITLPHKLLWDARGSEATERRNPRFPESGAKQAIRRDRRGVDRLKRRERKGRRPRKAKQKQERPRELKGSGTLFNSSSEGERNEEVS